MESADSEHTAPVSALGAAFAPPGGSSWARVAPRLAWHRRLTTAAAVLPAGALGTVLLWTWRGWEWGTAWLLLCGAVAVAAWFLAARLRSSWGYAEGATDFYLTSGVLTRRLVVIPYGRMQVVDVTADLIEQALGIATVRVRTAATTADTRLPGLPLEDAVRLRDRLAERSETFSTGL